MLKEAFLRDNPMNLQLFAEGPGGPAPAATPAAPASAEPAPAAPATAPAVTPATPGKFPTLAEFLNGAPVPGLDGQPISLEAPATPLVAPGAPITPQPGTVTTPPATPATPAPATPPASPAPGPRSLVDQIPDKFKNPDGTVNSDALMKSYLGMEKVLGDQGGKLGRLERQLQALTQGQPPQPPATPPAAQPKPAPQQPPLEKIEDLFDTSKLSPEEREKLNEQYYADPIGMTLKLLGEKLPAALQRAINPAISQAVAPLQPVMEHYQMSQQAEALAAQMDAFVAGDPEQGIPPHPDFADLRPQMDALLEKYGEDFFVSSPNPVEALYTMAKGTTPPPEPPKPGPTLAEMLADPATRQQIMADPSLKAEILKGYVQEVKAGAPPVLLGTQPGGQPVAMVGEKPKSVRDATRMFSAHLNSQ